MGRGATQAFAGRKNQRGSSRDVQIHFFSAELAGVAAEGGGATAGAADAGAATGAEAEFEARFAAPDLRPESAAITRSVI
jgi:hypothetical protein